MAWSSSAGDGRLVEESSCRRHDLLLHGGKIVLGHRLVADPCIDQGRGDVPVSQKLLDRGNAATGVDQLGGKGVS
jgi:hypothetical protein